jgi:hypothetical protein
MKIAIFLKISSLYNALRIRTLTIMTKNEVSQGITNKISNNVCFFFFENRKKNTSQIFNE